MRTPFLTRYIVLSLLSSAPVVIGSSAVLAQAATGGPRQPVPYGRNGRRTWHGLYGAMHRPLPGFRL